MTVEDIIDLLTIVQAGDNRTFGQPDVILWQKVLDGLDREECVDAVLEFRRDQPDTWLQPGHIVARVKAARRDRYERADLHSELRTNQQALWDAKAGDDLLPDDTTGYARGLYLEFDPAGWPYASGATRGDRAAAAKELEERIEAHIAATPQGQPPPTPAEAELALRLDDRVRAEEFLISNGRAHLVHTLGDQPPEYADMTRALLTARGTLTPPPHTPDIPTTAFSEPLHIT